MGDCVDHARGELLRTSWRGRRNVIRVGDCRQNCRAPAFEIGGSALGAGERASVLVGRLDDRPEPGAAVARG